MSAQPVVHPGATLDQPLLEVLYGDLHRLASSFLRRDRPGHTLQTSALVNEAYLRLATNRSVAVNDRQHYFRLAAHAMRHILVDYARSRNAQKRDAPEPVPAPLNWVDRGKLEDYLTVDTALQRLASIDPRQAEIVELRFFGGLSVPETAQSLEISEKTVKREWSCARAWLKGELLRGDPHLAATP